MDSAVFGCLRSNALMRDWMRAAAVRRSGRRLKRSLPPRVAIECASIVSQRACFLDWFFIALDRIESQPQRSHSLSQRGTGERQHSSSILCAACVSVRARPMYGCDARDRESHSHRDWAGTAPASSRHAPLVRHARVTQHRASGSLRCGAQRQTARTVPHDAANDERGARERTGTRAACPRSPQCETIGTARPQWLHGCRAA